MAAAVAVEDLLAGERDLDRPAEQQRRPGDDDLVVERIALAAEAAAVGRGDDADVRRRQRQHLGQRAVQVVRRLRRRGDGQLAVGVDVGRASRAARSAGACCPRRRTTSSNTRSASASAVVDVAEVEARPPCGCCRRRRSRGCAARACASASSASAMVAQRLVLDVDERRAPRTRSARRRRSRRRPDRRRSARGRCTARARPARPAGCRRGWGSRAPVSTSLHAGMRGGARAVDRRRSARAAPSSAAASVQHAAAASDRRRSGSAR